MRTTLDLNDDLLAEAKAQAARERLSLTRLIEEGLVLRLRLGCPPTPAGPCRAGWSGRRRGRHLQQPLPAGGGRWLPAAMTPDVNVLVPASRSDHPHHHPALTWLEDALDACGRGSRLRLLPPRQLLLLET